MTDDDKGKSHFNKPKSASAVKKEARDSEECDRNKDVSGQENEKPRCALSSSRPGVDSKHDSSSFSTSGDLRTNDLSCQMECRAYTKLSFLVNQGITGKQLSDGHATGWFGIMMPVGKW